MLLRANKFAPTCKRMNSPIHYLNLIIQSFYYNFFMKYYHLCKKLSITVFLPFYIHCYGTSFLSIYYIFFTFSLLYYKNQHLISAILTELQYWQYIISVITKGKIPTKKKHMDNSTCSL